jgi:hypothetical protein|tara:strand:+ start:232 stop:471 length:240 start_codon:yes stop_codon:yes gene_type:complete
MSSCADDFRKFSDRRTVSHSYPEYFNVVADGPQIIRGIRIAAAPEHLIAARGIASTKFEANALVGARDEYCGHMSSLLN